MIVETSSETRKAAGPGWSLLVVTAFESASRDCTAKWAANDIGGIGWMIGRARDQTDSNDVHRSNGNDGRRFQKQDQYYPFLADDGGEVTDDDYLLAPRSMEESNLPA